MRFCTCLFSARGKLHVDINGMICYSYLKSGFFLVGFLSIRFFNDKISANQISLWQKFNQLDVFAIDHCRIRGFKPGAQPVRCFLYSALVQSGFFRLEVQPIRCFSYRTSDMKYIDTTKVTEDSVYPHRADNRAVESGGSQGRRRSTVICHLHFTLEKLNRKSKDPVFYKIIVNEIIIVFSIRQFGQRQFSTEFNEK